MKQFNTLETIKIMLEIPSIMFQSIKVMDRTKDRYISVADLMNIVLTQTKHLDDKEKLRINTAFKLDAMINAQVIADMDTFENVKKIMFQDSILGMFRLCETSLYQELTDAKLKTELSGLWSIFDRMSNEDCTYSQADPDYTELVEQLNYQLGSLLNLLKRNLERMRHINKNLENMSIDVSKDNVNYSEYRDTLLSKITHLYERHILPTQRFVTPDIRLKDGENLLDTLTNIALLFEANQKISQADQVHKYGLSFSNIINPLKDISTNVNGFIRKTQKSIIQFNAMQWHYERFNIELNKTKDGRLNRTKLSNDFSDETDFLQGLKRQPKLKSFKYEDSPSYYANVLTDIESRFEDYMKQASDFSGCNGNMFMSKTSKTRMERFRELNAFIDTLSLRSTKDLIATLHYRLKDSFCGYELVDLLNSLTHVVRNKLDDKQVIKTNNKAYIELDGQYYVYRSIILQDTSELINE
ncbi:MAG: hypothetical protein HRU38_08570 [Saccharospirillaceae bacterium]|nr:hypothetical protein [Pseudomonadales bacterium]NRB78707.1 hypothetical protein [Saccharospirillaceae bacterium]